MAQGFSAPLDKFDTKSGRADIDTGGQDKDGKPTPTWMKDVPVAQETAVLIHRLQTLLGDASSAAVPFLTQSGDTPARITELLVAGDTPQAVSARGKLNAVLAGGLTEPSDNLTVTGDTFERVHLNTLASRLKPAIALAAG